MFSPNLMERVISNCYYRIEGKRTGKKLMQGCNRFDKVCESFYSRLPRKSADLPVVG